MLETEADLPSGTRQFPPWAASGTLSAWRNVGFRYRPETPVLNDIDVTVAAGSKIAIVGPTGAGKSTLLGLLPEYFDPTSGTVTIDGVEHQRIHAELAAQPDRDGVAAAADLPAVGRATISPTAAPAPIAIRLRTRRVWHASTSTIMRMPAGYETLLGEGGVALSEGEKQRITIARALLRDAPILILDEPTSALDVETEALVMEAIERLMEGRTTFIIAHRLSTVRRVDRILVLRDGAIAESGGYAELLRAAARSPSIIGPNSRQARKFRRSKRSPERLRRRPGVADRQRRLLRRGRSFSADLL